MLILLYRFYAAVGVLFILNAISVTAFSRKSPLKKLGLVASAGLMSLIWPLAIFSSQGRKTLLAKASKF